MRTATLLVLLCISLPVLGQQSHRHSSDVPRTSTYAGEQGRVIRALSAQEQRAWTEGQGMGLARAAELNGYPGPMHVLELAGQLQLTDKQAAATRALMDTHKAEVRSLGVQLADAERQPNLLFREKRLSEAELRQRTESNAQLQGKIRVSDLATHLKQTEILNATQVAQYNKLRGYE